MVMVRRQIYLGEEETRKVRRIARRRGATESEVIREAIRRLEDGPDDEVTERLRAAGLLVEPKLPRLPEEEYRRQRQALMAGLKGVSADLTGAVFEERAEARY